MTIVESGWNVWVWLVGVGGIYGCGYQEVSVSSGCGCKEVYRFPHITYPYSSCICPFLQQHPYFLFFFKMFFVLFPVHFCNCERSELSGLVNGTDFLYMYI